MNKPGITLTGVDERTPGEAMKELVALGAEIGVLYTFDSEGHNRYPRLPWIDEVVLALEGKSVAVHVCGKRARLAALGDRRVFCRLEVVPRIQVNGQLSVHEVGDFCAAFPHATIITQHRDYNLPLLGVDAPNHALLVDNSGGEGKSPREWRRPDTPKAVGFAGGLGAGNLGVELPKIAAVAQGQWWIDMEAKLRDEGDWFDVGRAKQCVMVFREWREKLQ